MLNVKALRNGLKRLSLLVLETYKNDLHVSRICARESPVTHVALQDYIDIYSR